MRAMRSSLMIGSILAGWTAIPVHASTSPDFPGTPFWQTRPVKERIRDASPSELAAEGLESWRPALSASELAEAARARLRLITFRTPVSFDYEFSLLVVDGVIRRAFLVSTAAKGFDPIIGIHRIEVPEVRSRPWPWKTSIKYQNSPMYWGLVIDGGFYFHSSPHYGNLGRPASKGCIRASIPDAMEVFDSIVNGNPGMPAYSLIYEKTDLAADEPGANLLKRMLQESGWTVEDLKNALKTSRKEIVSVSRGDLEYSPGVPADSHARPFSNQFRESITFPCCADVNCWEFFKKPRTTILLSDQKNQPR
ncbi:MAG: hypothetical protein EBX52_11080 [Proteobacteria bacterium]|nr:hypothetical protein [Pseudomonadota bacterium]